MRRMILVSVACVVAAMLLTGPATGVSEIHVQDPYGDDVGTGTFVDEDRDGVMDQGDRLVGWAALMDGSGVDRVGTLYGDCVVQKRIRASKGLLSCSWSLALDGGTIELRGFDPAGLSATGAAVTGGSGAFAGASGDATLTETETELDIVVHLGA